MWVLRIMLARNVSDVTFTDVNKNNRNVSQVNEE